MDRIGRKKRRQRFALLVLSIIAIIIVVRTRSRTSDTIISPIPDEIDVLSAQTSVQPTEKHTFTLFAKKKDPNELKSLIERTVDPTWSDYSVVVEDYSSDFAVRLNEGEIFVAASVNKIPILAALYQGAKNGDINLDRSVTIQAADIQNYGTGSIRYQNPGVVYTVKTLAKLMMKQSDNTAAYVLANHIIGYGNLKTAVASWGMSQTDMVENTTSNQDIAKLMRMIWERKITDEAHTQEILSFMKDTDFETRIPGKLPSGATAYHKIGTEVGIVHDAGIIQSGNTTYYVGIFTTENEGEETDATIAKLSNVIHEYMTQ